HTSHGRDVLRVLDLAGQVPLVLEVLRVRFADVDDARDLRRPLLPGLRALDDRVRAIADDSHGEHPDRGEQGDRSPRGTLAHLDRSDRFATFALAAGALASGPAPAGLAGSRSGTRRLARGRLGASCSPFGSAFVRRWALSAARSANAHGGASP